MRVSIHPLTKKKYEIPVILNDDADNIDSFIKKNKGKKIIVVQGLGFVGAVMSLVCANSIHDEYAVIGIDLPNELNYWKICSINEGIFPLVADDPKVYEYFKNAVKNANLLATFDPYCYSIADVIIVDINLDVKKESDERNGLIDFSVDLSHFIKAIESIGERCKDNALVLIETTVPPGTCQRIVLPTIEKCLLKRGLSIENFLLGHSYERVMPGPDYIDSIQNFYRVYSGIDEKSAIAVEKFLNTIIKTDEYPLTKLGSTTATEMAKVLENSFRAMNIAFIVEWSRFAEKADVNLYEVVDAIRLRPTHKNMMYPGVGVGGYCLTKDPLLASWASTHFFETGLNLRQSIEAVNINDKMPGYAFEFIKSNINFEIMNSTVLFLGVSYRGDVGDTRYTPIGGVFDLIKKNGGKIILHDPFLSYWEEKNENVFTGFDQIKRKEINLVIIGTGHSIYKTSKIISFLLGFDKLTIIDTIGLLSYEQINRLSSKHTIKVLGRGDL